MAGPLMKYGAAPQRAKPLSMDELSDLAPSVVKSEQSDDQVTAASIEALVDVIRLLAPLPVREVKRVLDSAAVYFDVRTR